MVYEEKKRQVNLFGNVEFDEVYVKAGHKGNPEAVADAGREGRRRALKGAPGRGTLERTNHPFSA
nr:hypothetical protein [Thiothrix nivea]